MAVLEPPSREFSALRKAAPLAQDNRVRAPDIHAEEFALLTFEKAPSRPFDVRFLKGIAFFRSEDWL